MMIRTAFAPLALAASVAFAPPTPTLAQPPAKLSPYNLIWTSPGTAEQGASASVPIGNGTVGANVWVEENGDLLVLISRIDAWSEADRLLKLGRVRLHMEPNPFIRGEPFRQELMLREGRIEWTAGDPAVRIALWVDSATPIIRIQAEAPTPTTFTATLENWRTENKILTDDKELESAWTLRDAPAEVRQQMFESADTVLPGNDAVTWYHRNEHSCVPLTLKHQGLDSIASSFPDPLLRRTFGGIMYAAGSTPATSASPNVITVAGTSLDLRIATACAQTDTAEAFITQARQLAALHAGPDASKSQTAAWWAAFWDRSWICIDGDAKVESRSTAVPQNTHPLRFGRDATGGNLYRGAIRRATLVPRALTASQVAALAEPGNLVQSEAALSDPLMSLRIVSDARGLAAGRCTPAGFGFENNRDAAASEAITWQLDAAGTPEGVFRGGWLESLPTMAPPLPQALTVEAVISPEANLGPARLFDKMTPGGSDGLIFDTHPGDSLRLIVGPLTVHARGVLKRGQWQHVAATYDAASGRGVIYLDGKQVAEGGLRWSDPPPPSRLTQAYTLQRWVQACGGGGRDGATDYPIKFNGSIFTVEPRHTQGQPFNPDFRKWGGSFWWQNTRLPYYPMLASGDFDMMDPLFRFYENALAGCKARAKLYYGADGVYFPETITNFATYANGDYGWKRDGLEASDVSPCPYWQFAWNQSLELTQLMLDYAAYTGDEKFLVGRALPMARETLAYFDSRFPRDAQGVLRITPTQAIETYWFDVTNDAPTVAGLRTVCAQLLALPGNIGADADRALWKRMSDAMPALPMMTRNGKQLAAPAEKYKDQRNNCETPELYAAWPFREFGLNQPSTLAMAIDTFNARTDRSTVGWTQDGLFAARLGLTDEAKKNMLAKLGNSHANFRFPAMWGPNFDWLPDQCHGSNLLTGLQLMLMQCDPVTGEIRLLPAWPADWNASFKLHAPKQTTVQGRIVGGKVIDLQVTPASRRKDVLLPQ